MKIITCEQGTEAWLKLRLGKFGSTDAQAVASNGKGLETAVFEKVAERLTGVVKESYTNEHIERGHQLEDMARVSYQIETGNQVEQVGYIEFNEYAGGSPDGLVGDEGIIEIKCPSDSNFVKYLYTKKIDTAYEWQMQHLLYITDRKWCDFCVFNANLDRLEITRVERDEAKIEKIKIGLESGIEKLDNIFNKVKDK